MFWLLVFFTSRRDLLLENPALRQQLAVLKVRQPRFAATQQLREAFPYDAASNCLIFDRAANFNEEVIGTVKSFGITPKQTNFRSPWQNGVAERWGEIAEEICWITSSF